MSTEVRYLCSDRNTPDYTFCPLTFCDTLPQYCCNPNPQLGRGEEGGGWGREDALFLIYTVYKTCRHTQTYTYMNMWG
jgi:hypothetical protein